MAVMRPGGRRRLRESVTRGPCSACRINRLSSRAAPVFSSADGTCTMTSPSLNPAAKLGSTCNDCTSVPRQWLPDHGLNHRKYQPANDKMLQQMPVRWWQRVSWLMEASPTDHATTMRQDLSVKYQVDAQSMSCKCRSIATADHIVEGL